MGGLAEGGRRVSLEEGMTIAGMVLGSLNLDRAVENVEIVGSMRRMKAEVGDVDLVVIPSSDRTLDGMSALDQWLVMHFGWQKNKKKPKKSGLWNEVQVDVEVTTKESWGAALMYRTGSAAFNVRQRMRAKARGMKLNEKGLWRDDRLVAGKSEKELYEMLEMDWVPPDQREKGNFDRYCRDRR